MYTQSINRTLRMDAYTDHADSSTSQPTWPPTGQNGAPFNQTDQVSIQLFFSMQVCISSDEHGW